MVHTVNGYTVIHSNITPSEGATYLNVYDPYAGSPVTTISIAEKKDIHDKLIQAGETAKLLGGGLDLAFEHREKTDREITNLAESITDKVYSKTNEESIQYQIDQGYAHRTSLDTKHEGLLSRIKTLEDKPYHAPHSGNGSGGQFGWFSEETCIGGVSAFGQEVSKGTCIPNWLILAPIGGIILAAGIIKM